MEQNVNIRMEMERYHQFVEQYLKTKSIHETIKHNPRYQAIIWHVMVMLIREKIPHHTKEAQRWINNNIIIGKKGSIGYALSGSDRYLYDETEQENTNVIQFIYYNVQKEQMFRMVKEKDAFDKELLTLESVYDDKGIEIQQKMKMDTSLQSCIMQRVENRPDLLKYILYDEEKGKTKKIVYRVGKRILYLEDFTPNAIEMDPVVQAYGKQLSPEIIRQQFPERVLEVEEYNMIKISEGASFKPFVEKKREDIWQQYTQSNDKLGRIKAFEPGMASLWALENKRQENR